MLDAARIQLPDRGVVDRAYYQGDKLSCSATGKSPTYVALIMNTTVMANTTNAADIKLKKGGNYSCVATNKYGMDTRIIRVSLIAGNNIAM